MRPVAQAHAPKCIAPRNQLHPNEEPAAWKHARPSSNFKEGQTKHIGVSNDELYGDALVKGNDWEDIWD